jgi:hypothetical protein
MYALERLHAELGGQILQNKQEAKRLARCMKHVEAVLKMLQPGYSIRSLSAGAGRSAGTPLAFSGRRRGL